MDGLISFEGLLRAAEAVGLDAVAITDHDTITGALEFAAWVRRCGATLQVIVGEERTLADGSHFIGLFLREPIQAVELGEAIREIEAQGGLCLVPHPFRRKDGLLRNGWEPLALLSGRPAGFELFSAKCSAAENERARRLLETGLAPFGGSDAHYECDLGECVNEIEWAGDLRRSVERMLRREGTMRILGKPQAPGAAERRYAPWYYRFKRYARVPKVLLPAAKQCYRSFRNWKHGVGRKPLREVYRHT